MINSCCSVCLYKYQLTNMRPVASLVSLLLTVKTSGISVGCILGWRTGCGCRMRPRLASGLNDARIAVVASLYRHPAIQTMRWASHQISCCPTGQTNSGFFPSHHRGQPARRRQVRWQSSEIGQRCKFWKMSDIGQALLKLDCRCWA